MMIVLMSSICLKNTNDSIKKSCGIVLILDSEENCPVLTLMTAQLGAKALSVAVVMILWSWALTSPAVSCNTFKINFLSVNYFVIIFRNDIGKLSNLFHLK